MINIVSKYLVKLVFNKTFNRQIVSSQNLQFSKFICHKFIAFIIKLNYTC